MAYDVKGAETTSASASEEQRLRRAFADLKGGCEALATAADAAGTAARNAAAVTERDAARAHHRTTERANADASQALDQVAAVIRSRAERLAPGLAAMRFTDQAWLTGEWLGAGSRYVRIGAVRTDATLTTAHTAREEAPGDLAMPALVGLLDSGNVTLVAPDVPRQYQAMLATLRSILLRAIATAPVGRCELTVFDPKIRGILSQFSQLRNGGPGLFTDPIATSSALLDKLRDARDAALRVAELAGIHDVADLADLRSVTGVQPEPYRIFVVLDYPYGIDTRVQAELLRLAHAGPRRGVSLVLHHDPTATVSVDAPLDIEELLGHTTTVSWQARGLSVSSLPGVDIAPDPAPARELIEVVCSQVAAASARGAAPVVEFRDLLPTPELVWTGDATHGVVARIGKSGTQIVEISLRGADPALPNLLVGGASGQGKSNLLLVMLHSLAATYSPEELRMYLLDFKEGLEFDRLGPAPNRPHWLPHAEVLGLEGDRHFGLAVLRHLDDEFRRRAELFRSAGANSLAAYRNANPEQVVPRLLLVVDEFQVLVAEADDIGREAISILETLARRGRAAGIHLVLASQTLSGIDTLASKERSIFGQFPWRVSLKTEASESEAILGRGNTAAATLRYRGEVVLNSEYGAADYNRRAVVAFADERQLDRLRGALHRQARPGDPPRVFYGTRPSDPELMARAPVGPRQAVVGLPIEVSPTPVTFEFTPDPGRALAVIGDGRDDATGVLSSATWSLARHHDGASAQFVIIDGLGDAGGPSEALARLADALVARGHAVSVRDIAEAGDALLECGQLIDERLGDPDSPRPSAAGLRSVYVIGAGLHRAPRLQQLTMAGKSPTAALQRVVRDGPLAEVFLIGWWNSLRIATEHLGYEVSPLLAGALFLRAPESDVQSVCGPYVRYQARAHRGLFIDRGRGGTPTPIVPFAPPSARMLREWGAR